MNTQEKIIYLQKRFGIDEQEALDKISILDKYNAQRDLPQEKIISLARKIKPLVRINKEKSVCHFGGPAGNPDSELYWTAPVDIAEASFCYQPIPLFLDCFGLEKICEITTYHQSSCNAFPNPTTFDVLCQMPVDFEEEAVGFEIFIPLDKIAESFDPILGLNRFQTIFYKGKMPKSIQQQDVIMNGRLV